MAHYAFTYPSETRSEEQMLDDLGSVLESAGVSQNLQRGFLLAVCEAFTNALLHGNKSVPDRKILVELEVNELAIIADITDEGKGGLERIRHRKHRGLLAEGGRGIGLIEHFADSVNFVETETGGLRVTITVSRTEKYITNA